MTGDVPVDAIDRTVEIPIAGATLPGHLVVPADAGEIVVFVHGSGSSRHSPRNRWVATHLNQRGFGTLLFDLLTPTEESDRRRVFDIDLLADRLRSALRYMESSSDTSECAIGLFGASTGAAAALWEASRPDARISAIVSRGGRPDLALDRLEHVRAPSLLIVGGRDEVVLDLNRRAATRLRCEHRISIVPGATHLFEEDGALASVARLAGDWFDSHR
jgi:putative phosphoribosyl transferase